MDASEFKRLGKAWDDCEMFINCSDDRAEIESAMARQAEIQKQMDAAPFTCDEEGNIVSIIQNQPTETGNPAPLKAKNAS